MSKIGRQFQQYKCAGIVGTIYCLLLIQLGNSNTWKYFAFFVHHCLLFSWFVFQVISNFLTVYFRLFPFGVQKMGREGERENHPIHLKSKYMYSIQAKYFCTYWRAEMYMSNCKNLIPFHRSHSRKRFGIDNLISYSFEVITSSPKVPISINCNRKRFKLIFEYSLNAVVLLYVLENLLSS